MICDSVDAGVGHPIDRVPVAGHVPVGAQRPGEAPTRHDAAGRVQRPAAQGPGATVPDTEVHQQAGQEEAGREAGPQGQSGEFN